MFSFARQLVKSIDSNKPQSQNSSANATPNFGFRVIHVDQNSPASDLGIEALFDFIVGINGHSLLPQQNSVYEGGLPISIEVSEETPPVDTFIQEINSFTGSVITLQVWTAKGRVQRSVQLPVGKRAEESGDFGLGMSLQWTPLSVADHVWHVLNVSPNSPAEEAGLISHADYIVGAENGLLAVGGEGLFARVLTRVVADYYEKQDDGDPSRVNNDGNNNNNDDDEPPSIELYVYNHDYDTLRPVRIQPTPDWGGSGLLGCAVGYGLLHRLPLVVANRKSSTHHRTVSMAPGDTLFEATPTNLTNPSYSPSTTAPTTDASLYTPGLAAGAPVPSFNAGIPVASRKKHAHPHSRPAMDLSSYMAEEQERSHREEVVSSKLDTSIPPPPKSTS